MQVEYLNLLEEITKRASVAFAAEAFETHLPDTSEIGRAFSWYMRMVVLRSLLGEDRSRVQIPEWVRASLFASAAPSSLTPREFLALFPGALVWSLPDCKDGTRSKIVELRSTDWSDSFIDEAHAIRYGVFFTPNGFGETRNGKGHLRDLKNVSQFNAVFVDVDGGKTDEKLAALERFTPSVIVETKNGYHAYWLLVPGVERATWQALQNAAIVATMSDTACSDASRLLRVVGTWHCKDEVPFLIRLHSNTGRSFDADELGKLFAVDAKRVVAAVEAREHRINVWRLAVGEKRVKELRALPFITIAVGQRHATATEEIARLYAGIDEALAQQARDEAVDWYGRSCQELKRNWENEAQDIVDWVETREFGRIVSVRGR